MKKPFVFEAQNLAEFDRVCGLLDYWDVSYTVYQFTITINEVQK